MLVHVCSQPPLFVLHSLISVYKVHNSKFCTLNNNAVSPSITSGHQGRKTITKYNHIYIFEPPPPTNIKINPALILQCLEFTYFTHIFCYKFYTNIVIGIPVTPFEIDDDPSAFETAQVKVLPNAGGLTMSTFSYVAEALLVTVCTIL